MPTTLPRELLTAMTDVMPFTVPEDTGIEYDPSHFDDSERIEDLGRFLQFRANELFLLNKAVPTTILLFVQRAPDDSPSNRIVQTVLKTSNERTKKLFYEFIRKFGALVDAIALAALTETWSYAGTDVEGLRAHQAKNGGSFEGFPGVVEQVSVRIEYDDKNWLWRALILRSGENAVLGDWEKQEYTAVRGNMIGLLNRRERSNSGN